MQKMTVAEARRAESAGKRVRLQGWIRTRRDSKGGFSFLELNDGSSIGNIQIIAEAALPNYESEIKRLSAGCSVTVDGEIKASPAKGQATEVRADAIVGSRLGRSRNVSAAKEAAFVRVSAHAGPSAAAHQHLWRDRPRAQLHLPLDPRLFSGRRLSLRPRPDHHGQRLRRGGRDVQGHDARPGQGAQSADRPSTTLRIFSIGRPF